MLLATELVFDEITSGSSSYATALITPARWANGDRIAAHAVAYVLSSGGSPELSIQIDHSADGRTWTTLNASPEVDRQVLSSTRETSVYFAQDLASCGPKLRLRVWQQTSTDVIQVRIRLVTRAHGSRLAPTAAQLRAKLAKPDDCGCDAKPIKDPKASLPSQRREREPTSGDFRQAAAAPTTRQGRATPARLGTGSTILHPGLAPPEVRVLSNQLNEPGWKGFQLYSSRQACA